MWKFKVNVTLSSEIFQPWERSSSLVFVTEVIGPHFTPNTWNPIDWLILTLFTLRGIVFLSIIIPAGREVFCLPKQVTRTDQLWKYMVDVSHCSGQVRPRQEEECNRFPCPQYWEDQGWTDCDRTCGIGYKTLKVRDLQRRWFWLMSVLSTRALESEPRSAASTPFRGPYAATSSAQDSPVTGTSHHCALTRYNTTPPTLSLWTLSRPWWSTAPCLLTRRDVVPVVLNRNLNKTRGENPPGDHLETKIVSKSVLEFVLLILIVFLQVKWSKKIFFIHSERLSTLDSLYIDVSSVLLYVLNQPSPCDSRTRPLQFVWRSVWPHSPPDSSSHWGNHTTPRPPLSPSPAPSSPCSQTLNKTRQWEN